MKTFKIAKQLQFYHVSIGKFIFGRKETAEAEPYESLLDVICSGSRQPESAEEGKNPRTTCFSGNVNEKANFVSFLCSSSLSLSIWSLLVSRWQWWWWWRCLLVQLILYHSFDLYTFSKVLLVFKFEKLNQVICFSLFLCVC